MVGVFSLRKRGYERITVNIQVNYFYNNESYAGTVTNLSINGMHIEAEQTLPIKSKIDVLNPFKSYCVVYVPFREGTLKLIVKVRRLTKAGADFASMGVEIVNPSQDYLEFVSSIRNYCLLAVPHQTPVRLKNITT